MRILILNFIVSTSVGGKIITRPTNQDTMIYNLARGFADNGDSVTLCVAEEFKPENMPEREPFDVVYFPSRLKRIFKPHLLPYPKGLGKFLRRHRGDFDMVLSVEAFSMPTLVAALNMRGKMLIWHEMAFHQSLAAKIPSKLWHNLVGRFIIRRIPMLTQSEAARKFCTPYYKNVAVEVMGHGANEEVFTVSDESDDYFVVMSMLVYRKRIDEIIRRFAEFVQIPQYSHYKLRIIGEGPEKEALEGLVSQLGVNRSVLFEGFKNHREYARIGARAKGLLIRTQQDNNMVTVPEAIVAGTPILMNTVPNNHTFVRDLGLGIVKDDWGAGELAQMAENYDRFHQNCLTHRDRFTTRGVARHLKEIFRAMSHSQAGNH